MLAIARELHSRKADATASQRESARHSIDNPPAAAAVNYNRLIADLRNIRLSL
jgi:hypothetical protein